MNKFKDNLKRLVKADDITARATKIAPQIFNNWLSGQKPRSLNNVKEIAGYFSITIDELSFGGKHKRLKHMFKP